MRIKALGLPKHEWPEFMQDLAVLILEFKFDPDHENGASEMTALYGAISNRLLYRLRCRGREEEVLQTYYGMCGGREDNDGPPPDPCGETDHGRRVDVADALAPMSEFDRAVAKGLAEGHSRFAISRQLGCSWNTVERAVARLRGNLAGLDPQEGGWQ